MTVEKVYRLESAVIHRGAVKGRFKEGDAVTCEVDRGKRFATSKNHTATHLLHKALRTVVGEHARQAGSYVAPDSLRFDFTHFSAITPEEIKKTADRVNDAIFAALPVKTGIMSRSAAVTLGAVALFGEKYGDEVRVVNVEGFSQELCGGTHVNNTDKIGLLVITSESGIAAGVRRIEALTGRAAFNYLSERAAVTGNLSNLLKTPPDKIVTKLTGILEHEKYLEKKLRDNDKAVFINTVRGELGNAREINGANALAVKLAGASIDDLRAACEDVTGKKTNLILLLSSVTDGKVVLVCGVSKDLLDRYNAGNIVKQVAPVVGGSGGGRPGMAQAGGTQAENLEAALAKFYSVL
jgi:alanyl-tRNA synthetase